MADDADRADKVIDAELRSQIAATRKDIPAGNPGECDLCGEWSGRLVNGACAPCRDKYGLE